MPYCPVRCAAAEIAGGLDGVIFAGGCDLTLAVRALIAFLAFCAIASAVYIGNDIVDKAAARSAGIAHILGLDRARAMRQHPGPRAAGVAPQIHRDVDLPFA